MTPPASAGAALGASPAPAESGDGKNIVMLSADHFPKGMAPKEGDKITFCVTGQPDSEGNVSGYFESMGGEKPEMDWDAMARADLSPTKPEGEAS